MISPRHCLLKLKAKFLNKNSSSLFISVRRDVLDLQSERRHFPFKFKCANVLNPSIVPQNICKLKQKHVNISSGNMLMQSTSSCLTLPMIHRCFYPVIKCCSDFGLSLFAIQRKHYGMKKHFNTITCCSQKNYSSRQWRGYSDSKKDTINIQQLLDHALKNAELPSIMLESSRTKNRSGTRNRIKRNVDCDDGDNFVEKPLTVEKKLLSLMEMWKMDEAVDLLIESLKTGFTPNSGVVLNLLQQLANLGEVDNILELHDEFLEGKSITREVKFYALLTEAYCNSGRIEEGVAMLRIIYHKTRNFDDTDPFFSMITIMVIRNFEHHLYLIVDFVNDLMESDPPVDKAVASLWKCLVLTERFDQADALVEEHENLLKFIPAQVSEIVNTPFYITYNKDVVLSWLMNLSSIKRSLKAAVFESLIENKCENNKWQEALDCLREAMADDKAFVKPSTLTLFFSNFLSQLSDNQVKELEEWATLLEEQNLTINEPDNNDNKDS